MELVSGQLISPKCCPDCGGRMFVKRACPVLARHGFQQMLRCLSTSCGHMEGYPDEDRGNHGREPK